MLASGVATLTTQVQLVLLFRIVLSLDLYHHWGFYDLLSIARVCISSQGEAFNKPPVTAGLVRRSRVMFLVSVHVGHEGMGLFLAMVFHQPVIPHDLTGIPVGDDVPPVNQHDTVTYFQDEFKIMRGDQHRLF